MELFFFPRETANFLIEGKRNRMSDVAKPFVDNGAPRGKGRIGAHRPEISHYSWGLFKRIKYWLILLKKDVVFNARCPSYKLYHSSFYFTAPSCTPPTLLPHFCKFIYIDLSSWLYSPPFSPVFYLTRQGLHFFPPFYSFFLPNGGDTQLLRFPLLSLDFSVIFFPC